MWLKYLQLHQNQSIVAEVEGNGSQGVGGAGSSNNCKWLDLHVFLDLSMLKSRPSLSTLSEDGRPGTGGWEAGS